MKAHRSNIRPGPKRQVRGGTSTGVDSGGGSGGNGLSAWSDMLRAGPRSQSSGGLPWRGPVDHNCQWPMVNWQLGWLDPPWLAVRHREVDIGHKSPSLGKAVGYTLPIRYERARESIARLVVRNTSNLPARTTAKGCRIVRSGGPKAKVNATETLGRCRLTCFFASDAVHEFPRIRSAGLFPMMSFRRSGFPQLLLMQPSLLCRREVCEIRTSK